MHRIDPVDNHVITSKCFQLFNSKQEEPIHTLDRIWSHHSTTKMRQLSEEYGFQDDSAPNKVKGGQCVNRIIMTVFWNAPSIFNNNNFQRERTIDGD